MNYCVWIHKTLREKCTKHQDESSLFPGQESPLTSLFEQSLGGQKELVLILGGRKLRDRWKGVSLRSCSQLACRTGKNLYFLIDWSPGPRVIL